MYWRTTESMRYRLSFGMMKMRAANSYPLGLSSSMNTSLLASTLSADHKAALGMSAPRSEMEFELRVNWSAIDGIRSEVVPVSRQIQG